MPILHAYPTCRECLLPSHWSPDLPGCTCPLPFHISLSACRLPPAFLSPKPPWTPPEHLPRQGPFLGTSLPPREAAKLHEKAHTAGVRDPGGKPALSSPAGKLRRVTPLPMSCRFLGPRKGLTAQGSTSNCGVTPEDSPAHNSCTLHCNHPLLLLLITASFEIVGLAHPCAPLSLLPC